MPFASPDLQALEHGRIRFDKVCAVLHKFMFSACSGAIAWVITRRCFRKPQTPSPPPSLSIVLIVVSLVFHSVLCGLEIMDCRNLIVQFVRCRCLPQ